MGRPSPFTSILLPATSVDNPPHVLPAGLAACLYQQKKYVEAEDLYRRVLDLKRQTYGENHMNTTFAQWCAYRAQLAVVDIIDYVECMGQVRTTHT